jgi:hypothetical protein
VRERSFSTLTVAARFDFEINGRSSTPPPI